MAKAESREKSILVQKIMGEISGELSSTAMMNRLISDLKRSTYSSPRQEIKYIVDFYYRLQEFRIAVNSQMRELAKRSEPTMLMSFLADNLRHLEDIVKKSMGAFAAQYKVGKWLQSICGIGPVLSAGFLVTFDIRDMEVVSSWWSYAGLDPNVTWEAGKKRPWDAGAKVLVYKVGESFVKVQNREKDFYGKLYAKRKEYETKNNEDGDYADQARRKLEKYKIGKTTDAYKAYSVGKLPPAHIHARSRRWAGKIFLSHFHEVAYRDYYNTEPKVPYVFSTCYKGGGVHTHRIDPPPYDFEGKSLRELWLEDDEYVEVKKRRDAAREEKLKARMEREGN